MNTKRYLFLAFTGMFFCCQLCMAQQKEDTSHIKTTSVPRHDDVKKTVKNPSRDSTGKKIYYPRTAAIRSAILPGLGQAYNKKYWKIPIVYGALGTTAVVFNFNLTQYKRVAYAYRVLVNNDTANFKNVEAELKPFLDQNASSALRNYRNEYRKNIDYSVLVFLFFWGLNVVDATVDAHLKGFDVSGDISLKIKPGYNPNSNTTGLTLAFDIHKKAFK